MTTDVLIPKKVDTKTQIDALFRALNAHDVDKIVALHAKTAVFEDPTLAAPAKGPKAIGEQFRMMFRAYPDLKFTMERMFVDGDHAAARWTFVGTHTGPIDPPGYAPTGKSVTVHGVCFYDLKDGLFVRHTSIYDLMGMLHQLGLMPALDSMPVKLTAGLQRVVSKVQQTVVRH